MDGIAFFQRRFAEQEFMRPGSMEALWAELPTSPDLNPDMWEQTMTFWKDNFALSAQFGNKSKTLVNLELLKSIKWEGVGWDQRDLTRVLDELLKEQPPRIQAADAIRGVGIAGKVGRWVSDWAWGMVGYARNPLDDENEYVVVAELKRLAEALLSRRQALAAQDEMQRVVLRSTLLKEESMTPYDIDLALTWLRNAGQCAVAPLGDDLVIKFATSAGSGKAGGATITEKDVDMAKLYQAVRHLDENLAAIEREMEQDNGLIKKHLALGQKTQAMAVLKRRKTREQHYSQRSAMRDNVLQIIMETHGCETHQQVIAALKTGASLLKSQQPDVEQVHDTMNDVAEALEENREIETALAQSVGGELVESDSDLLAELEDLEMKEDEEALLAQVASAPSVPAGTPKAAATLSSQPSREAQAAS